MAQPGPEFKPDTRVWPTMGQLLECVRQEYIASGFEMPARVAVHPGEPAFDFITPDCKECDGELWVRLVNAYVSHTNFPNEDNTVIVSPANPAIAYVLEVGTVFAMDETTDDLANPATVAALEAGAERALAYMSAIRRAICKCLGDAKRTYVLGAYTPYGPQGFAIGGSWQVIVKR